MDSTKTRTGRGEAVPSNRITPLKPNQSLSGPPVARRFPPNRDGSASYSAFTDFLGHKDLGEKTMLFIVDGLYGNDNVDGPPHRKWKMAPFNDAWPNSIFMSLDGVAIDSVGFDFLISEWPDLPDMATCRNYLREAALAHDPP